MMLYNSSSHGVYSTQIFGWCFTGEFSQNSWWGGGGSWGMIQSNLGYPNAHYPKLGLFEDDDQSRPISLLFIAIKLPIIRISIIRKIQFFEVIRRSRSKKLLLNYPSIFEVKKSRMVIMISVFGRVRFTHLSDLANKVATGN